MCIVMSTGKQIFALRLERVRDHLRAYGARFAEKPSVPMRGFGSIGYVEK